MLKKKLSDIKIGEKFYVKNNLYLRIDLDLPSTSLTTKYPDVICALDLSTYKIVCMEPDSEVKTKIDWYV